jgi:hypothetical protein
MRARVIGGAITGVLAILAIAATAFALTGGGSPGYVALGPYFGAPFTLTGSCGNAYVVDTPVTRYRVFPQKTDGSYIVEQFFRSSGRTLAGSSPEACASGSAATVAAGIRVETHGDELGLITGGTFNPQAATCASPCFFAQFTPAFFGPTAVVAHLSSITTQATACNGSVIDNGIGGVFAGDITGERSRCTRIFELTHGSAGGD